MEKTKIEWTDATDNPIRTADGSFYCFKVSEACDDCYAERMAARISAMHGTTPHPYKKMRQPPEMELRRDMLAGWAKKGKPKKRFVTSMTDLAGEFVPDEWFFEIMDAMRAASLQTFQTLTKRAQRFEELCIRWMQMNGLQALPRNIWPGMTVENMRRAHERLPHLLNIPAYNHWISAEPLLEPLHIREYLEPLYGRAALTWVVAGGESGNKARPTPISSFRQLRDDCKSAGVAFFFKQWGEWHPELLTGQKARSTWVTPSHHQFDEQVLAEATPMYRVGKHNAGHILDGHEWHEFPETRAWPRPDMEKSVHVLLARKKIL